MWVHMIEWRARLWLGVMVRVRGMAGHCQRGGGGSCGGFVQEPARDVLEDSRGSMGRVWGFMEVSRACLEPLKSCMEVSRGVLEDSQGLPGEIVGLLGASQGLHGESLCLLEVLRGV